MFLDTYGSPLLQALVGLGTRDTADRQRHRARPGARGARGPAARRTRSAVRGRAALAEAVLRALIYIRLPEGSVDERGFAVLKADPRCAAAGERLSLAQLKEMLQRAVPARCGSTRSARRGHAADCCRRGRGARRQALDALRTVLAARGDLSEEGQPPAGARSRRCSTARAGKRPGRRRTRMPDDASGHAGRTRPRKYERLIDGGAEPAAGPRRRSPIPATRSRWKARSRRRGSADRADPGRPGGAHPRGRGQAGLDISGMRDRRRRAQPRFGRQGGRAGARGPRRGADEGQPAHRRTDGRRGGARGRHPHRAAHQPLLHHGRAEPSRRR